MIKNIVSLDRKIRIGVVGCGRISKKHFEAIESHCEQFDLISVCDTDASILSANFEESNLKTYLDLREMMENENLDLVVLCTPSGLHAKQTELVAKYGVCVMTEKPMATRWHDGIRMVKACDDAGVQLFVVKQNRRNHTLQKLKNAIVKGRFGRIYMVNVNVFWTRPQEYYNQGGGWRGTWEFDGGAFMNQASHNVDLLDWLIGPVERVQAMISTSRKIETEDTGVVNVKWRNGALGSMAVTMLTYPENLEGSITILGETGSVQIGGVAANEIKTWKFADKRDYDEEIKSANYKTTSVYGFGHLQYYENIIDVMRGNAEPETEEESEEE